ncbi:MAG: circularly permuted type 2 ATP-grasp protein, partial [Actinomycetota bacterium]|nr:circularly permuted type 2 ATP-grasp protein [Actinomycetota bacterium]
MSGSTALERLGLTYSPAGSELGIELGRSPGMAPHLRGVPRHDEMVDARGDVRRSWRGVGQALGEVGPGGLRERARTIARLLADDGATYRAPTTGTERLWSLDPLPMVVDAAQWVGLERGLVQRAELLDHVLADLYGPRRLITSGLIPPEVVYGHPGFIRQVDGITLPAARQLFLASADLARDSAGQWRVLGDRTQAASGAGYAMENRGVLSRALPGLYRGTGVHRIAPFFHTMRRALQQLAHDDAAARVVLLTPGAHSETAFDQALLSSLLGFPLVE